MDKVFHEKCLAERLMLFNLSHSQSDKNQLFCWQLLLEVDVAVAQLFPFIYLGSLHRPTVSRVLFFFRFLSETAARVCHESASRCWKPRSEASIPRLKLNVILK
jgi:hypothetical protein